MSDPVAPHVYVCIPSTGFHTSETSHAYAALCSYSEKCGVRISHGGLDQAGIAASRNNMCAGAEADETATHVLQMDSDMGCPPNGLVRLLAHDVDIVGCPYPMRMHPYPLAGKPKRADAFAGLEEMEFLPGGFLLVKTSVFRALPKPWFFETYAYEGDYREQLAQLVEDASNGAINLKTMRIIIDAALNGCDLKLPDGRNLFTQLCGEDVNFCYKAQRHGFKVWGDLDLMRELVHVGKQHISLGAAK